MEIIFATKNSIYDNSPDKIKTMLRNIFNNTIIGRNQDNIYFYSHNTEWDSAKDENIIEFEIWLYGMKPDDFCLIQVFNKYCSLLKSGNVLKFDISVKKSIKIKTPFNTFKY